MVTYEGLFQFVLVLVAVVTLVLKIITTTRITGGLL